MSGGRSHQAVRPPDFHEGGHGTLQLFAGVARTQLDPDSGLPLGHDRVREPHDVDPLPEELGGHRLGQWRLAEHDRHDRVIARPDPKVRLAHGRPKPPGVRGQPLAAIRGLASYDDPKVVQANPKVVPAAKKELANLISRPQVPRYNEISRGIADSIEHCVLRLDPQPGEKILDLATGTGWTWRG